MNFNLNFPFFGSSSNQDRSTSSRTSNNDHNNAHHPYNNNHHRSSGHTRTNNNGNNQNDNRNEIPPSFAHLFQEHQENHMRHHMHNRDQRIHQAFEQAFGSQSANFHYHHNTSSNNNTNNNNNTNHNHNSNNSGNDNINFDGNLGNFHSFLNQLSNITGAFNVSTFTNDNNYYSGGDEDGMNWDDFLDYSFQHDQQQQRSQAPATSEKAIQNFPTFIFTSEQEDSIKLNNGSEFCQTECSICISDFALGEVLLCLPCQHTYHKECILPWVQQNNTCPVCRYELPVEDEQLERERVERMKAKFTSEGLKIMEIGAQVNTVLPTVQRCRLNFEEFLRRVEEAERNGVLIPSDQKRDFLMRVKNRLNGLERNLDNFMCMLDALQDFKEERIKKQRKMQVVKIQEVQSVLQALKDRVVNAMSIRVQ